MDRQILATLSHFGSSEQRLYPTLHNHRSTSVLWHANLNGCVRYTRQLPGRLSLLSVVQRGRPREPCFGTARSRIYICIFLQSTGYAYAVCIRPRHSRFHLRRDRGGICTARPASTSRSPATLAATQYRRALRGRPARPDGAPRRTPCTRLRSDSDDLARTSTLVRGTPAFAADLSAAS